MSGSRFRRARRGVADWGIAYVIAILIGLAVPVAAVALYFGVAVYLIVPFREVARLLPGGARASGD
jgi:ABC-type nickel/cobalt efflux system permease component RcnA